VDDKPAAIDAQGKSRALMIKQREVRANSHQVQLKDLGHRTTMLAVEAEWPKTVLNEMRGDFETI
jgi:hypothetical protein